MIKRTFLIALEGAHVSRILGNLGLRERTRR